MRGRSPWTRAALVLGGGILILCGAIGSRTGDAATPTPATKQAVPPRPAPAAGKSAPPAPPPAATGTGTAPGSGGVTGIAGPIPRFGHLFGPGGLRRLHAEGAHAVGRYGQQNTYTGPGHALISTCAYGYMNGITQNKFYNRKSGRAESMLYDPLVHVLGEKELPVDEDGSPRNLVGSSLSDELLLTSPKSKAVSVSLKARGAILLGGHLGQAYFFSDVTGEMSTSTYYAEELPAWARDWNAQRLVDKLFGQVWERLLPESAYVTPDDSPHEADLKGLGRTFPHQTRGGREGPGQDYYDSITYTPIGLEVQMSFARAALDAEQLGRRGVTDYLAISVSGTDLAGHLFGPYSHEYQDMVLRFDREVEKLLGELEKRFKPGEFLVAFTADHGASPIPEWLAEKGILAGRVRKGVIKDTINQALTQQYGLMGDWVVAMEDPSIYLSPKMLAQAKVDPLQAEELVGRSLLSLPGVLGYFTRTQLMRGWMPPNEMATSVSRSYFPLRGGDVVMVLMPYYFWGKYGEKEKGTSHGSFYRYDTDVPVMFWNGGPGANGLFQPGHYGVIDQVDFAATIAHTLRITPPSSCAGRPILPAIRFPGGANPGGALPGGTLPGATKP
jgi:predicted AlkP superfamily pyrophosphatase or phosphodiesterase